MKKQAPPPPPAGPLRTSLPLWQQWSPRAVGSQPQAGCQLCSRGAGNNVLVAPATDEVDVVILVGSPTIEEDEQKRPFMSFLHTTVSREATKILLNKGESHALVYTAMCRGGSDDAIDACRPHVKWYIDQLKPKRIVAVGTDAVRSIAGEYVDTQRLRRAWTIVDGVPVLFCMDPVRAFRNRFSKKAFFSDFSWALTSELPKMPQGQVSVINSVPKLEAYLHSLNTKDPVIIDVEHKGRLWDSDFELLCVGLCQDPEKAVVVIPQVIEQAKQMFGQFLADPRYPKANQNIKHDRHALYRATGYDMAGIVADTMLWGKLREPEAPAGLGPMSWLVGFGGYKASAKATAEDDDAKGGDVFASMPLDELHAYNGRDTAATARLIPYLRSKIDDVFSTWRNLIGPAFDALALVERNGMLVSVQNVHSYHQWLTSRLQTAEARLAVIPGLPLDFNPGSPKQVAELLFVKLKLPVISKTKTGAPSTDKDVMRALKDKHPIIPILSELSVVRKQISTYGLPMLDKIDARDGRIHTTFKLVRTGRLSSSEPNMQNITASEVDDDEGAWARGIFIAPPGHKLVNLDYGQMELRVACMLSGDTVMAKDFQAGHDYHTMTAAGIFGVKPEDVTKEQRAIAKNINFGLIYGQTAYGLSMALKISEKKAQGFMDAMFGRLKKFAEWRTNQIAAARITGKLFSVWDPPGGNLGWKFRRQVWGIGEEGQGKSVEKIRKHFENVALNTPVQGLANCFTLASIAEIVRWTQDEQPEVKVVMTVHDSIVLEVPDDLVVTAALEAKAIMLQWDSGIVSLAVDVEVGQDWGHMKKLGLLDIAVAAPEKRSRLPNSGRRARL